VRIWVHNELPESTGIHWYGLAITVNDTSRLPMDIDPLRVISLPPSFVDGGKPIRTETMTNSTPGRDAILDVIRGPDTGRRSCRDGPDVRTRRKSPTAPFPPAVTSDRISLPVASQLPLRTGIPRADLPTGRFVL
jgi:hypothetical protein